MPSPFPGMDPWLEAPSRFPDVHDTMIAGLREAINAVLPPPYFSRSATRVLIEDRHRRVPDVSLRSTEPLPAPGGTAVASVLTAAGMIAFPAAADEDEEVEERYLEVRTADDDRLVTAVEILSPSNKTPGERGRDAYLTKQAEYLSAGVGLVEIDLLRGGWHTTAVRSDRLRRKAGDFAYHICTSGMAVGTMWYVAPIRLADPLPRLIVPLDAGVQPVAIELQPLFDRCYDTGLYARQIRYDRPTDPPLTPHQQAWADAILREKKLLA